MYYVLFKTLYMNLNYLLFYVVPLSRTAAGCPNTPCYHGGTCVDSVCQCPAFCKGEYCEDCDRDPYPPQKQVTIGAVNIDVVLQDGYIVSNNNETYFTSDIQTD